MNYLIVGGDGFIGSHLRYFLEDRGNVAHSYDRQHGMHVEDLELLTQWCGGADVVVHLASNADIAAAVKDPTVDFYQGTLLTQNVLEACRLAEVPTVLYASGSGIYGECGDFADFHRAEGDIEPISTYGASKLAGEALLSAYCHMFGITGRSFRFANVVGPNQTHGVGFDFLNKLKADPEHLDILGDGTQRKPYLHVDDAISAMLTDLWENEPYDVVNVAPVDTLTVTEIADLACATLGLQNVEYRYSGGDRGWPGDVPQVELDTTHLERYGWFPTYTSSEAMRAALEAMACGSSESSSSSSPPSSPSPN